MENLKVGDKVLTRSDLMVDSMYGANSFVDCMLPLSGKICTISKYSGTRIEFEEDKNTYVTTDGNTVPNKFGWTIEMLVDVVARKAE